MLKRVLIFLSLFLIFNFKFLTFPTFAHPVDQVFLDVYVDKNDTKTAHAELFLSWQQLGYVIDKFGNLPAGKKVPVSDETSLTKLFEMYKEYDSVFTTYFKNNLTIQNSNKNCSLEFLENPVIDQEEILVGKGYKFKLNINCENSIEKGFYVKSNLYVDDYPYQTLFVDLRMNEKQYTAALFKDDTQKEVIRKNTPKPNIANNAVSSLPNTSLLQNNFYSALKSGSLLAFILLFLIGALHTLEAGHSKAIIFSLASHKDTTFKQGLSYVLVFTITHVADILLLAIFFIFLNSTVDIYKHLPKLSKLSLATLLLVSLYMLFTSIKNYKKTKEASSREIIKEISHTNFLNRHDLAEKPVITYTHTHGGSTHSHNIDTKNTPLKKQLLMGFLAGIAPCFMGWSIFLVVLTTKNLFLIIPLILSFALGIAFTLFVFLFLALKLKKPLYSKFSIIGDISPIISALILIIYAVTALIKL